MALWVVALLATIAPASWKAEGAARHRRATSEQPDLVDGTGHSTPGMDDTDFDFPPRPPVLGQGRYRQTDPGPTTLRHVSCDVLPGCLGAGVTSSSALTSIIPPGSSGAGSTGSVPRLQI